jgi:glyoxylase-like metal-dependent hydrolase (beta-lactamase superfamily II)
MICQLRSSRILAVLALSLTACSSPPSQRRLADDAIAAMGGREKLQAIRVLALKGGTGTRYRLGQTRRVGDAESPTPQLTNVVETADLVHGRASLDYELTNGDFMQHRHEILTMGGVNVEMAARGNITAGDGGPSTPVGVEIVGTRPVVAMSPGGLFSWGTQNSPEFLLRRNIVTIALAAANSMSDTQPAQDKELNGRMLSFGTAKAKDGEEIGLYFDPESKLIAGFEVLDTETILGDVQAQYLFDDYKAVDGVSLPHHVTIRKGGKDYSDVRYTAITINDAQALDVFAIPESLTPEIDRAALSGEAVYTPLALTKVANGVYFARAYSHNSMIVEFPSYIAVVEAPYTETQSTVLARLIREQFPNKPIQYAAVTHHHYDHIGGVRGIAAEGATLLVAMGHEPAIRALMDARHTHPADELEKKRSKGVQWKGEFYEGKQIIVDGKQTLELYAVAGSPHAEPIVLAYVRSARVLFQSDLWFPGTGGTGSPAAKHLLESVRKLDLRVDTHIGGHGGVAPFAELVAAVEKMPQ